MTFGVLGKNNVEKNYTPCGKGEIISHKRKQLYRGGENTSLRREARGVKRRETPLIILWGGKKVGINSKQRGEELSKLFRRKELICRVI